MAKKEKAQKEKPLEKMTAKELRETALSLPEITGAHGMNKEELLAAIKQARGIVDDKKEKGANIREIKKKVASLKEEKRKAQTEGNKKRIDMLRRKLSRMKKKTRRAA